MLLSNSSISRKSGTTITEQVQGIFTGTKMSKQHNQVGVFQVVAKTMGIVKRKIKGKVVHNGQVNSDRGK